MKVLNKYLSSDYDLAVGEMSRSLVKKEYSEATNLIHGIGVQQPDMLKKSLSQNLYLAGMGFCHESNPGRMKDVVPKWLAIKYKLCVL